MNIIWGRTQWLLTEEPSQNKRQKGRNIGEWSETLAILHCLLFPNISIDGKVRTVRAVEHNGVTISVDAVKNLDIDVVENRIYHAIFTKQNNTGSFDIDDDLIKNTLIAIGIEKMIKGPANLKHDIVLHLTDSEKPLSFNIKSLLGDNPSIINPSKQTSVKYKLKNPRASVSEINIKLNNIDAFSDKIKYLRTICDDIISDAYTSEAYQNALADLDEYAFIYIADWLLTFFEHTKHAFIDSEIDLSWFNRFIIMSMTKITPRTGIESKGACGLAFLYNAASGPRLYFTMGESPEFSKQLCKYVRFGRPSFTRHKKHMLGNLDSDYSFRLPIQIRLQSAIKEIFK